MSDSRPDAGPPPEAAVAAASHATLTTLDLLVRARAGNPEALNDLCARYHARLSRWAHGRLPRHSRSLLETADLVQEAIVRTVQRFDRLELAHDGSLQAYFRQAIMNRIRDQVRAGRGRENAPEAAAALSSPGPSPLESVLNRETLEHYEAALARLTEEDQLGIHLRLELDYSYAQIAEALAKPSTDAARMCVNRAIGRLAREMRDVR